MVTATSASSSGTGRIRVRDSVLSMAPSHTWRPRERREGMLFSEGDPGAEESELVECCFCSDDVEAWVDACFEMTANGATNEEGGVEEEEEEGVVVCREGWS